MADSKHLELLKQGVEAWNKWRDENPEIERPDLQEVGLANAKLRGADLYEADIYSADLSKADLAQANLVGANLRGANLMGANLMGANLTGADLQEANLAGARLFETKLIGANLSHAELGGARLDEANLEGTNLEGANLSATILVNTRLERANLSGCNIFGTSVWGVNLTGATQSNLRITRSDEPSIEVDDLKVGQFVYLLLKNDNIRDVIGTIGKKGVLILGRFTEERKGVLDAIRNKLRELGLVPMMFDFEPSAEHNFTETIRILAGLSRFIIADITKPKSSPLELQATVPEYMIPFAPIIQAGEEPFAMFRDLSNQYEWVLKIQSYNSTGELVRSLKDKIIDPALKMSEELWLHKQKPLEILPIGRDRPIQS